MKRLLFRLLLTASLFLAPLLLRARMPLLQFVLDGESSQSEAADESFVDDAEWEEASEYARPAAQARLRRQRSRAVQKMAERSTEFSDPRRFTLVVDVRRVKPKRLFAPPYVRPRVVRLLS